MFGILLRVVAISFAARAGEAFEWRPYETAELRRRRQRECQQDGIITLVGAVVIVLAYLVEKLS